MRLLVCGGRRFNDYEALSRAIGALPTKPTIIIEGGAKGADSLARGYAVAHNIHYAEVPALWDSYGPAAGHKRNEAMLLLKPEFCLAMPGGAGTADMVRRASQLMPTWEPYL